MHASDYRGLFDSFVKPQAPELYMISKQRVIVTTPVLPQGFAIRARIASSLKASLLAAGLYLKPSRVCEKTHHRLVSEPSSWDTAKYPLEAWMQIAHCCILIVFTIP